MFHSAVLASAAASLSILAGSTPAPNCQPNPRAAEMPGMIYRFEDFTRESAAASIAFLADTLPGWVTTAHARTPMTDDIWGGDIGMAHYNAMNRIKGYILKLDYLLADADDLARAEKEYCDFAAGVSIVD